MQPGEAAATDERSRYDIADATAGDESHATAADPAYDDAAANVAAAADAAPGAAWLREELLQRQYGTTRHPRATQSIRLAFLGEREYALAHAAVSKREPLSADPRSERRLSADAERGEPRQPERRPQHESHGSRSVRLSRGATHHRLYESGATRRLHESSEPAAGRRGKCADVSAGPASTESGGGLHYVSRLHQRWSHAAPQQHHEAALAVALVDPPRRSTGEQNLFTRQVNALFDTIADGNSTFHHHAIDAVNSYLLDRSLASIDSVSRQPSLLAELFFFSFLYRLVCNFLWSI